MDPIRVQLLFLSIVLIFYSCSVKKVPSALGVNPTIRVMSYNIHHGNPPGKANVIDIDGVAAVIRAAAADLVAVQEVDVYTRRSGGLDQAALLAQKAGYSAFFFARAMDFNGGQYGVLILSKYPLKDTVSYALPKAESNGGEPRVLALATVRLPNGRSIRFGCTHLEAYNKTSRLLQVLDINRIGKATALPFIVAGDFNASVGSPEINTLDAQFLRTCNPCPATFIEAGESGAIDFIAVRPKERFAVRSHTVVQNREVSDHLPVMATLQLQ